MGAERANLFASSAADVGSQTRSILSSVRRHEHITAAGMLAESTALHERTGHTAGNGSLTRTAPVALAHLNDPQALTEAATAGRDSVVIISADAAAPHQSVVTVMEAARRVGLSQITFATQSSAQAGR